jgi:aerobic-type carbon monoxide dehydrogenase small subunit (CoxS/CutS family)
VLNAVFHILILGGIMTSYDLQINGQAYTVEAEREMPLLWVLRDLLGLTGTKFSCGAGLCGSCTVLIDDEPMRSCVTLVETATGKSITTIEGLSPDGTHPLQKAWLDERVTQCGYCQPGQIMNAAALLKKNPNPSDTDINAAMGDVLCRCGTYQRIRSAIHRAAQEA